MISRRRARKRVAKSIVSRAVSAIAAWSEKTCHSFESSRFFSTAATQVIQSLKCIIGFLAKPSHEEVEVPVKIGKRFASQSHCVEVGKSVSSSSEFGRGFGLRSRVPISLILSE